MPPCRRPVPLAAVVALLLCAVGERTVMGGQVRIRGGVDLVSLHVTVTEGGRYVTDLDEADFEIYEDGVRQDISFFSRGHQPIALAVLLDTSASMENTLTLAQDAAVGFARRMREGDIMEVVEFNAQVNVLQTFTGDRFALERAIRSTVARGSTALFNAVYIALKSLERVRAASAAEIRRQAVVVLSDGDDTSSLVAYDEVLDQAKRSETAIYTIGLRPTGAYRREFKGAEFVLRQLSQQTGGHVYFPASAAELPRIYEQIAQELASQYSIGYTPRNEVRNGAWRRITVRLARPGLVGRTRQGYFAPAARS